MLTASGLDWSFCSPNLFSSSGSLSLCSLGGGLVVYRVLCTRDKGWFVIRNGNRRNEETGAFCGEAIALEELARRCRVPRNIMWCFIEYRERVL